MNRTHNQVGFVADPAERAPFTPADILRGAARYLEIHGWTQGVYCRTENDPFPPCCAIGAIGMVVYGRTVTIPGSDCRQAIDVLTLHLDDLGIAATVSADSLGEHTPVNPIDWNDRPGQSADNVIATLRAAAENFDHESWAQDELDNDRIPTAEGYAAWRAAR